jgi:hypothetical protein
MRWIWCALVVLATSRLAAAQTTQPSDNGGAAPTTQPLSADQMLSNMLRPTASDTAAPLRSQGGPPAVDAKSGNGALAPNAPSIRLLREGDDIVDRVGWVQKSSDGQEEFVFDSDGRTLHDPPVILLPNLMLMLMENKVGSNSDQLRFRITGTVTEYRGRNYVLLRKVVVVDEKTQDNP